MRPESEHNKPDDMSPIARILFGWVGYKHTGNIILGLVVLACIIMTIIDLGLYRHEYFSQAEFVSFYGLYSFAAFGFVVLMGWPLGWLLRRGENYYGDSEVEQENIVNQTPVNEDKNNEDHA